VKKLILVAVAVMIAIIVMASGYFYATTLNSTPSPTSPENPESPEEPPAPHEPVTDYNYELEFDLASSEGFRLSSMENVNRDLEPFFVLYPEESGSILINLQSNGGKDCNLSLDIKYTEFDGVEYSFTPATYFLKVGEKAQSLLQIDTAEDAPMARYTIYVSADSDQGGEGVLLPDLLIAPFVPDFIFTVKTQTVNLTQFGGTTPEGETPLFEKEQGEEVSVLIYMMDTSEPLTVKVTSSLTIDFELLNDVIEVNPHPRTPASEVPRYYQLNLKSNPETPQGTYTITLTGTTESYTFERTLMLKVK